jgi:hypothetical protein
MGWRSGHQYKMNLFRLDNNSYTMFVIFTPLAIVANRIL